MLAEALKKKFVSFYRSEKSKPELQQMLDLLELYGQFGAWVSVVLKVLRY